MLRTFHQNLRIVWALTAKDIGEAIKNKNTLSILIMVVLMLALYRYLPTFEQGNEPARVLVYDPGKSSLATALDESPDFRVYTYDSEETMRYRLTRSDLPELGLVIPAGFDQALASGEQLQVEGYFLHWVSATDAERVTSQVEEALSQQLGSPVTIHTDGNIIYTRQDSTGLAFLAALSVVITTTMIGLTMVPHLLLEEKSARTIDVLLVSPATPGQIVMGKALTGLFYGLLGVAVAYAFFYSLITHWGLAILAAVAGTLFTVALGLLFGSLIENRQQMTLFAWFLLLPLLVPVLLSVMTDLLPVGLSAAMRWVPTVALTAVLRIAFAEKAPLSQYGLELALVLGPALLLLAIVAWIVRRSDR